MTRNDRVWSRREIEGLIADGRRIVILGNQVLKTDAWIPYHPGGDRSILHMVGRDGTDEITALHSRQAQAQMQKYAIGRVEGRWENFVPPIQGGTFRPLVSKHPDESVPFAQDDATSTGQSTPSSAVFDTNDGTGLVRQRHAGIPAPISRASSVSSAEPGPLTSTEASVAHAISSDPSNYPGLDGKSQHEVVAKYRQLDQILQSEGLYHCPYSRYAVECTRYAVLYCLFLTFLHYNYYALSALCLGLLWHLLSFVVHDAGHLSITHGFHIDTCIGILVADFIGGLSVGWWKRNHNVHHIATNSPEHDPDIQHMPFFAISPRFFYGLRSTYYDHEMRLDAAAHFFIKYQHYLYYPILLFGRFNLYRLAWSYLLDPKQAPRKGPAWWHRYLEVAGHVVFWYWFGYRTLYLSVPSWSSRLVFLLISHMATAPLHVQLTLSHFAMSSTDFGIQESFAQKMVRTTMDDPG